MTELVTDSADAQAFTCPAAAYFAQERCMH